MQLDYGRQQDMEELYDAYESETSPFRREQIEKSMNKILSESGATRQLRDELIRATRTNNRERMEYLRIELRRVEAEKYNNNIQL